MAEVLFCQKIRGERIILNKAVIILAHPNMEESRVNKRWIEEVSGYTDKITVHDLYKEYPEWNINIKKEQEILENHDLVILQFPFYWYSSPPLLKKWIDDVLEYDWAYGDDETADYKLKDKKIGISVTIGEDEAEHSENGKVSFTIDELLSPFIATINYVGAIHVGNYVLFDAVPETPDKIIDESAKGYVGFILEKLKN